MLPESLKTSVLHLPIDQITESSSHFALRPCPPIGSPRKPCRGVGLSFSFSFSFFTPHFCPMTTLFRDHSSVHLLTPSCTGTPSPPPPPLILLLLLLPLPPPFSTHLSEFVSTHPPFGSIWQVSPSFRRSSQFLLDLLVAQPGRMGSGAFRRKNNASTRLLQTRSFALGGDD
ncbi:unnamed protein product [Protopolystoma xenopodis]|uniref:Uncharacterized protein n=1 Tax=Protopolystoma xenopodis TaxID=117903 RepID=A0A448WYE5_9PLAT|nr:unnamed protein product [Protopolystoma xenopodis]